MRLSEEVGVRDAERSELFVTVGVHRKESEWVPRDRVGVRIVRDTLPEIDLVRFTVMDSDTVAPDFVMLRVLVWSRETVGGALLVTVRVTESWNVPVKVIDPRLSDVVREEDFSCVRVAVCVAPDTVLDSAPVALRVIVAAVSDGLHVHVRGIV